jgi:polysaccharide pyruvyl transferase CsaB
MSYRIVFYCPDTNLKISGDVTNKKGLGGGKTAIVKMADALRKLGNNVKVYAYCEEGIYNGVEYHDFLKLDKEACDIFIAITGQKCDLSELPYFDIRSGLKIAWLSGAGFIKGINIPFYDFYYANSVFLKKRVIDKWGLPHEKVIATHQGFDPNDFNGVNENGPRRDMFGIVFASHPSKGLLRIIEIVEKLKEAINKSFFLDIYGGYKLWNDSDDTVLHVEKEWADYKGMLSQPDLCKRLFNYNFMLHLTGYEDTSSVLMHQAKRAGVAVIASDVGGNSEIIKDGYDGFIIKENYLYDGCEERVIKLVKWLIEDDNYAEYIRKNAKKHSMTWDKVAKEWQDHWDKVLGKTLKEKVINNGKQRERSVLLSGFYGFGNLGDELILKNIAILFKEIGFSSIYAVSGNIEYSRSKHSGIEFIDRNDYSKIVDIVRELDLIVLGGGGLFQDHNRLSTPALFENPKWGVNSFINVPLIAKIYSKPVAYIFQGVGPLFSEDSHHFTRFAYSLAAYISVRDKESQMLLKSLGINDINLSADPTLLFPVEKSEAEKTMPTIGISLRQWIHKNIEDKIIDIISQFLNELDQDFEIIFLPFQDYDEFNSDIKIFERIIQNLKHPQNVKMVKINEYALLDIEKIMASLDCIIGMRLHSIILALKYDIPFVAIPYDQKIYSILREADMTDMALDIENPSAMDLLNKLKHAIAHKSEIQDKISSVRDAMIKRVENDIRKINNFVENPKERTDITISPGKIETTYLYKYISEIRSEINSLHKQLGQMKEQLTQMTAERDSLDTSLNMIINSNFWKVASRYYKIRDKSRIIKTIYNAAKKYKSIIKSRKAISANYATSNSTSDPYTVWKEAQKAEKDFWIHVSQEGYAGFSPEDIYNHQRQIRLKTLSLIGMPETFWYDKVVVEVGSGPAGFVEFIKAKTKYAIEPLIQTFRQYYPYLSKSDVTYFENTAEAIPLSNGIADLVICHNMLDHVINPDLVMSECSRVAKSGGYLLFQVNINKDPLLKTEQHKLLHPHTFTERSAQDIIEKNNFKILKVYLADKPTEEGEYSFIAAALKK